MQTIGDCSSFQFIQSMEIDPGGKMWAADNGYVGTTRNPQCSPKMYVIDIQNSRIIKVVSLIPVTNNKTHKIRKRLKLSQYFVLIMFGNVLGTCVS